MSTKIILNIEEGLSRQEMDDLRYLLSDAVSEFAVVRSAPETYVDRRYPGSDMFKGEERAEKISQVTRRVALARKVFTSTQLLDYEHTLPHAAMPIFAYYQTCDEDDLPAMSAALDFLPASLFGERKGWVVERVDENLVITGPDDQRAVWWSHLGQWQWVAEHVGAIQ